MTVKSLPEEGFRASGIDFQYGSNTYLRPMHTNSRLEYFIYNNWEYWTEIGTYNRTDFNSIGSVSVSDTSFIFNGTFGLDTEDVVNWYLVYDLNGVIISEEFMVNGVLKRHFERVFPIESTTEPTTTTLIITSNGATITDATIIDPLPISFPYLYFLFLPILLKIKYRSIK